MEDLIKSPVLDLLSCSPLLVGSYADRVRWVRKEGLANLMDLKYSYYTLQDLTPSDRTSVCNGENSISRYYRVNSVIYDRSWIKM